MKRGLSIGFVVVGLLGIGCGSDPAAMMGDDDPMMIDAPPVDPGDFLPLIEGDWSLPANDEGYFCVYATIASDVYLDKLRPIGPPGTHHTVLTVYEGTHADGVVPCNAGENGQSMIYGSGVGAPDFAFPPRVGLHLAAGTRLLLNLHLYNGGDTALTGRSGVRYHAVTAADLDHQAEVVLAGPTFTLQVPTGGSTASGNCAVSQFASAPVQVFALSQHMHKRGVHLKTTLSRNGAETVLQDKPYNFEVQEFHDVTPVELRPGDTIRTECTYMNPGAPTGFGDSSDQEMCFSDLFFYPAQNANFVCTGT